MSDDDPISRLMAAEGIGYPEAVERLVKTKLGATGEFPDGKLDESDEGGLRMAVSNDGRLVRVDFGKPVAWFAVPADIALGLASSLTNHAMALKTIKQ